MNSAARAIRSVENGAESDESRAAQRAAQHLAAGLLDEIAGRWPVKAGKLKHDAGIVGAWARAIIAADAQHDAASLRRALDSLSASPWPPDIADLLAARSAGVSEEQARRALARVQAALSRGEAWRLKPRELLAVRLAGGGYAVRIAGEGELPRWRRALNAALAAAAAELPPPLQRPAALLEQTMSPREVRSKHLCAMLNTLKQSRLSSSSIK